MRANGKSIPVPAVSIGLPTYNRPDRLMAALNNFQRQSFTDFELIVSDNASPDPDVRALCEKEAAADGRIRYIRRSENCGMDANFWFVFEQARAPYFMWASDDDVWPADFIARGVCALERRPACAAWFCRVENINADGETIRTYPSLARFSSPHPTRNLVKFLWEPEVMGKCLLLYSLYRRAVLTDIVNALKSLPATWGLDNAIAYGLLCRSGIVVEDGTVFQKRIPTPARSYVVDDPRSAVYPWSEARIYFKSLVVATRGTRYAPLTASTLALRLIYDKLYHERLKLMIRLRRFGLLPRVSEPG
jgi:glycosyltransferase involved in cell wall biosynthesis